MKTHDSPATLTSPLRRLTLLTCAAIGLVGVFLLLRPFVPGMRPAPPTLDQPAPVWVASAPRKGALVAALERPEEDTEGADTTFLAAVTNEAARLTDVVLTSAELEMRRVLARGEEYDSELSIAYRGSPAAGEGTMVVRRQGAVQVVYRVRLADRRLARVEMATSEEEPGREIGLEESLPIGLGDIQMADLFGLAAAAEGEEVRRLGRLQVPNSVPLEVVELRFPVAQGGPPQAEPPAQERFDAVGSSALVYAEAATLLPRSIRIFDRGDRLVRLYSDIRYTGGPAEPRVESLRVSSIPDGSSTTVRVRTLAAARR